MENFNKNNPTQGWTEDEKYDFCKMENKWLKELSKGTSRRKDGLARAAKDPTFSSVEQLNIAFENDILRRKETWRYPCHICDYATNTKQILSQHLTVHGIGERFKCDKCDKDFSKKTSLKTHRESHISSSCKKCNECGKTYKTAKSLKEHIRYTHSEKHMRCDQCEMMFSTIVHLNRHKKKVHVLKSFKCDQCKYRTKTKANLYGHIQIVHNGLRDKSAKCDLCDFQGTANKLKVHKEMIHENKKFWFCKACPYSTYLKGNFRSHMRRHTGEKPYQCKICRKHFTRYCIANSHCKS